MPTTYTHRKFASDVAKLYPQLVNLDNQDKINLFNIGTHGPDITFYTQLYNPFGLSKVGYKMHEEYGNVLFKHFADIYHSRHDNPLDLAYILGFLAHFTLDSAAHPTVYKYQENDNLTHSIIEMQFDRFLLVRLGYNKPTDVDLIDHIHPKKLYASIMAPYFPGFNDKTMYQALKDIVFIHHIFYCKNSVKRNIVRGTLNIPKNKFIRDMVMIDQDLPQCKQINLDLLNCYNQALSNYEKLASNYLDYLNGKTDTLIDLFNHNFEKD